ncbi:uncharacterized protein LOC120067583 [Benincasa hispida]|uniref:uncharacterized protein LOC120067583 n=1 Tax=Benincasa hispida TaxID=102211 RepID=UPI001900FFE1|nr:uncharacterized protein LOC120067583 [Benincasa hispida]
MLTMQVAEVEALKNNLLPFLHLSQFANFKFSRSTVSLTASRPHSTSCLYVQLKISEPFFTLLSINPNGIEEFHSCLQIDDFFLATSLTGTDDRLVTFLMPDDYSFTNLFFTTRVGHLQYNTALAMSPPLEMNMPEIDDGPFVAITAEWFRDIATRLSGFNTRIWVTATVSQVVFSAVLMEFKVPIEENRCMVGGSNFGDGVRFSVTFIPLQFFIQASYLDKMVYFNTSTDRSILVTFLTGNWTNIVACNPEDRWEVLHK